MLFNEKKCEVMHVGKSNNQYADLIKNHIIDSVETEKDLGVIISRDIKVLTQCNQACSKANNMVSYLVSIFSL